MVKFIMVFLLIMAVMYTVKEGFNIFKTFRKGEEFKQPWYKTALSFASISYIITVLILGL